MARTQPSRVERCSPPAAVSFSPGPTLAPPNPRRQLRRLRSHTSSAQLAALLPPPVDPSDIPLPSSSSSEKGSCTISDKTATFTRPRARACHPSSGLTKVSVRKSRKRTTRDDDRSSETMPLLRQYVHVEPVAHPNSKIHARAATHLNSSVGILPPDIHTYLTSLLAAHTSTSEPAVKRPRTVKEIGSFRLPADVARAFCLQYSPYGGKYRFTPPTPSVLIPTILPHLTQFIEAYIWNFDRGSESTCRAPIDVLLNQCLVLLKGQMFDSHTGQLIQQGDTDDESPAPTTGPNPFAHSVVVHGEVLLDWTNPDTTESYAGRIDYALGVTHPSATFPPKAISPVTVSNKSPRIPYQSYLLIVEAKRTQDVESAVGQLFGYLAILFKQRKAYLSRDIYGIATDGLLYDFLMISSKGVMKRADRIDLGAGPEAMRKMVTAVVAILQQEACVLEGIVQRKVSPPASRVVSGEISGAVSAGIRPDVPDSEGPVEGNLENVSSRVQFKDVVAPEDLVQVFVDTQVLDIRATGYLQPGGDNEMSVADYSEIGN
ncbi:hypothetical protein EV426DRAFT_608194 [Tirmania nivea]|nr:hypothetical protein EV426DRAFT_608194 [Tirmania nivea]